MKNKKTTSESRGLSVSRIFDYFIENESIIKVFLRRFNSNSHDIEDICQETILRALQAEKNKEIYEPKAFLFGIAKNVARKGLEKKSKTLIDFIDDFSDEEYSSTEPSLDEHFDSHKRMLVFWEAITILPPQCQRVFVLKKVHGYSHKYIAKNLDISISTVEKHVATGLQRTSDYMNDKLTGTLVDFPMHKKTNKEKMK